MDFAEYKRALDYIEKVRWQFAKTMPRTPHWYTVMRWAPGLESEMRWFAVMIEKYGKQELFYGRPQTYLYLGEYKYWKMEPIHECDLINRARID